VRGQSERIDQQRALRDARTSEMADLYREGNTLQQIGDLFGITRERVRQLIGRQGLKGKDGGLRRRAEAKRVAYHWRIAANRDERTQRTHGCSYAVARHLNGGQDLRAKGTPAQRFWTQKHNAVSVRHIEWRLTFPEWMAIWLASGHFHERGRGGYVMARYGDIGPYSVTNVKIITHSQNSVESRNNVRARGVLCADGRRRYPENIKPQHM